MFLTDNGSRGDFAWRSAAEQPIVISYIAKTKLAGKHKKKNAKEGRGMIRASNPDPFENEFRKVTALPSFRSGCQYHDIRAQSRFCSNTTGMIQTTCRDFPTLGHPPPSSTHSRLCRECTGFALTALVGGASSVQMRPHRTFLPTCARSL